MPQDSPRARTADKRFPGGVPRSPVPVIVAADMGYGHLRPATSIADALGLPVHRVDAPPLAEDSEVRTWSRHRRGYELVSRLTQSRLYGRPFRGLLEFLTKIHPLYPRRDQSSPTRSVRALARLLAPDAMAGLFDYLDDGRGPLVTTFYAPAIAADLRGRSDIHCVVTDSDLHRIWAPPDTANTRINYLVPSRRALRRLRAYGVPRERIEFTGFPLPEELVGGADSAVARRNLAARICRLDPDGVFRHAAGPELQALAGALPEERERGRPPLLTLAIGGAGAQVATALRLLDGLIGLLRTDRLRVALVAGIHDEAAGRFRDWISGADLPPDSREAIRVLHEPGFEDYYRAFNRLLAETDLLWTKPSELVFYAALGIPLLLSPPIGCQERCNRRHLLERGAAIEPPEARRAGEWLGELLADGVLAGIACSGYTALPRQGTARILESIRGMA